VAAIGGRYRARGVGYVNQSHSSFADAHFAYYEKGESGWLVLYLRVTQLGSLFDKKRERKGTESKNIRKQRKRNCLVLPTLHSDPQLHFHKHNNLAMEGMPVMEEINRNGTLSLSARLLVHLSTDHELLENTNKLLAHVGISAKTIVSMDELIRVTNKHTTVID
jgi:hypothetical protein